MSSFLRTSFGWLSRNLPSIRGVRTGPRCSDRRSAIVASAASVATTPQVDDGQPARRLGGRAEAPTPANRHNQRPTWLDLAHRTLDHAVLDARGRPRASACYLRGAPGDVVGLRCSRAANPAGRAPAASARARSVRQRRHCGAGDVPMRPSSEVANLVAEAARSL